MADFFVPPIPPQENPSGDIQFKVRKAEFGDGYSQRVQRGINNKKQRWPFTFVGTNAEIDPIVEFMDEHEGAVSFWYTPPFSLVPILFVCESYQLVPAAASNASITVLLEQVYGP